MFSAVFFRIDELSSQSVSTSPRDSPFFVLAPTCGHAYKDARTPPAQSTSIFPLGSISRINSPIRSSQQYAARNTYSPKREGASEAGGIFDGGIIRRSSRRMAAPPLFKRPAVLLVRSSKRSAALARVGYALGYILLWVCCALGMPRRTPILLSPELFCCMSGAGFGLSSASLTAKPESIIVVGSFYMRARKTE